MTMSNLAAVTHRKDFLSVLDFDTADLERCLELAAQVKADRVLGRQAPTSAALNGRHVAMLFEKPSLRTRTTFEIAVRELGGEAIGLQPDVALGQRETVADVARNLERWVDAIVIRTFSQRVLEQFATSACRLHVINALTDEEHPCQAVADFLTLREHWGTLARPDDRVRRRREQCGDLAGACLGDAGREPSRREPRRLSVARRGGAAGDSRRAAWRAASTVQRGGRRRCRRRCRLHRHLDVDGAGSRKARSAARRSPRTRSTTS